MQTHFIPLPYHFALQQFMLHPTVQNLQLLAMLPLGVKVDEVKKSLLSTATKANLASISSAVLASLENISSVCQHELLKQQILNQIHVIHFAQAEGVKLFNPHFAPP
jgi:hypothetical protein